ncbi:uncharacterized protein BO95DRAFT_440741 [Aspergillus brunneoviolaceus CBS 621.78]|uniref:Uncharacterized protein n=1 Tax=Aspergillus brunneoviolaceus CBS 621.78 TaxID=1450534 RepID=A0ACD1GFP7_9EURO|nr:hypothetical protein BO95DRAFT_440741 [Aspergillus brunneoviolaceus CBS 621.78]RAH48050.1 hypothetical protein BO95DRAFT_440741 [Aspergillus brunneoviolaceus CBS 621.78]
MYPSALRKKYELLLLLLLLWFWNGTGGTGMRVNSPRSRGLMSSCFNPRFSSTLS